MHSIEIAGGVVSTELELDLREIAAGESSAAHRSEACSESVPNASRPESELVTPKVDRELNAALAAVAAS
ncbi:hypothetical protein [Prescottella equi]|uniref:hypothetical protein n=1 Tax=Rhodococcus hoagii TaxID=43767 RepID=UPI00384CACF2